MKKTIFVFTSIFAFNIKQPIISQTTCSENTEKKSKEFTHKPKIVAFTENKGQVHDQDYKTRPDVLYSGTDGSLVFHLKKSGISYQLNRVDSWKEISNLDIKAKQGLKNSNPLFDLANKKEIDKSTIYRLDINWLNANTNPLIKKGKSYKAFDNYYLENCPNGALNVKSYEEVTYENIYTGINLRWYQKEGHLKYDYVVSAGSNYKQIQLEFKGATAIKINGKGELVIKTPLGNIIEQAPLVIQDRKVLKSNWIIKHNIVSFNIENLNLNTPFVIDPVVRTWGTYYGGFGYDYGYSCTTDAAGNVYIAGNAANISTIGIATSGAHQTVNGGGTDDAFLVKFDATGVRLWGTYYGGTSTEYGRSCTLDASGNVYLGGETTSSGAIIATPGAHQTVYTGGWDAFLVKFNTSGIRQWGTYYGGSGDDRGQSCATDAGGNVFLSGFTTSTTTSLVATPGAHQTANAFGIDGFLVKFNSSGSRQWGTYYGGSGDDVGYSCITDAAGNAYLSGYTNSTGTVIATPGAHQSTYGGGSSDAFLVKFDGFGTRQWGTFYGGSGSDIGYCCTTDNSSNIFLVGGTASGSGIATAGSHQTILAGSSDAFLTKLNSQGLRQWGTYYGGGGNESAGYCIADGSGNLYMTGYTSTTGSGIATAGAYQAFNGGSADTYLVKFDASGARQWGTFYGGNLDDISHSCALDNAGNVYVVGETSSSGSALVTAGAHQTSNAGGIDGFLVKFNDCSVPPNPTGAAISGGCSNKTSTLTATSSGATINWYATPNSTVVLGTGSAYITPTLSVGTYTYYAEAYSCVPSLTRTAITLTVNATPTITTNSGTICMGNSFTINPTGANTYTITGGSSVVSPTTMTSYSVTGTSSFGCIGTNTAVSTITVSALPSVSITSTSSLICAGQSSSLTASGAITYTWSSGATTAVIAVTPTVTTSYTVHGVGANGCDNFSTITQSVTICTAISDEKIVNRILNVFPNPAKDRIYISLNGENKELELTISNSLGQVVYRKNEIELINEIDISELSSGIYFIQLTENKNFITIQKVIKL